MFTSVDPACNGWEQLPDFLLYSSGTCPYSNSAHQSPSHLLNIALEHGSLGVDDGRSRRPNDGYNKLAHNARLGEEGDTHCYGSEPRT